MMRFFALLTTAIALLTPLAVRAEAPKPPNVLWVCADDLAPYVVGCYGNKVVKTPNLDRLASEGMRFDRAFCNAPVCTASRQSFLTGRYPRTVGVTQLKTPLPEGELTLARLLKAAGYDTASFGKMHFNSALTHGFDVRKDLGQHAQFLKANGKKPLPEGVAVLPTWRPFRDPASVWLNSGALPIGNVAADMAGTWFAEQAATYFRQPRVQP